MYENKLQHDLYSYYRFNLGDSIEDVIMDFIMGIPRARRADCIMP